MDKERFWTLRRTNTFFCHQFSPPDLWVDTPWDSLDVILATNGDNGSPLYHNSVNLEIYMLSHKDELSSWNYKTSQHVTPGNFYDFGLEVRSFTDKSGTSDCVQFGSRERLDYFEGYSYWGCMEECNSKQQIEICKCAVFFSILFNQAERKCNALDAILCAHDMDKNTGGKHFEFTIPKQILPISFSANCNSRCHWQCSDDFYDVKQTWTKFPMKSTYQKTITNTSKEKGFEFWKKNGVQVKIHMASMVEIRVVKRRKYSLIDTISAFGGLGGLLVGASLMTSFEMLFFISDLIQVIHKATHNKKIKPIYELTEVPSADDRAETRQ